MVQIRQKAVSDQGQHGFLTGHTCTIKVNKIHQKLIKLEMDSSKSGPEVIKLFFMLNSIEHETLNAQ